MVSTNSTPPFTNSSPIDSVADVAQEVAPIRRRRRTQSKLDETAVREIRAEGAASLTVDAEQLGKRYGVSVSTIKAVLSRKTWKDVD